jgi:hypothetical protein
VATVRNFVRSSSANVAWYAGAEESHPKKHEIQQSNRSNTMSIFRWFNADFRMT